MPPLDWHFFLRYRGNRATPGVEAGGIRHPLFAIEVPPRSATYCSPAEKFSQRAGDLAKTCRDGLASIGRRPLAVSESAQSWCGPRGPSAKPSRCAVHRPRFQSFSAERKITERQSSRRTAPGTSDDRSARGGRQQFSSASRSLEPAARVPHRLQPAFAVEAQSVQDRLKPARNRTATFRSQLASGPVQSSNDRYFSSSIGRCPRQASAS
jgi:hypothetical protein